MMGISLVRLVLVISFGVQVLGLGMFQVSIMAIFNYRGEKADGQCCDGSREEPPCNMECRTFFSICLLHYLTDIPDTPPCQFGHTLTPVLGGNSINETALSVLNYFPLNIPFSYTWPGTFTLVIDVLHDAYHNRSLADPSQRILRTVVIQTLYPPTVWKKETSVSESVDLLYNFRILCAENYYGPDCNVICRPRSSNLGHYLCDENGTKVCLPGWEGDHCQQAICPDGCDSRHGYCVQPFTCRCAIGWTGSSCDQCLPDPSCGHGYCVQPSQCICNDGWRGEHCHVDTNFCMKTQPCRNGGTCMFDQWSNYTCICPHNVTGAHCDTGLCYHDYCQNGGHCYDDDQGPMCACQAGYEGNRCEQVLPTCPDITCQNNGTCIMKEFGPSCVCAPPFTGTTCEIYHDVCDNNPCKHGTCFSSGGSYTCVCEKGYKGDHCDTITDLCDEYICYNGGTCVSRGELPVCECFNNYTGQDCRTKIDLCVNHTCQNGGSCKMTSSNTDGACVCLQGYTGRYCELQSDLCQKIDCKNGGICKQFQNSTKCICDPHYDGDTCEFPLLQSDQSVTHPTLGNKDWDMSYTNRCPAVRHNTLYTLVIVLLWTYLNTNVKL